MLIEIAIQDTLMRLDINCVKATKFHFFKYFFDEKCAVDQRLKILAQKT